MAKQQLSCIIVDDDLFSRETLEDLLGEFQNIKVLRSLSESGMAIKYLATLKPDIAFLDIDMPDKDGLSILNEINDLGIACKVVFVTSYEDYLLDAFKKNAFDYLKKPVNKRDIEEVLERFYAEAKTEIETEPVQPANNTQAKTENGQKIVIHNSHDTILLEPEQIAYIEADGCYSSLHLVNSKNEVISKNIGRIEKLFPENAFFKISRSIIINISYVKRIDRLKKEVQLNYNNTNISLKASRNQLYDLESFLRKG